MASVASPAINSLRSPSLRVLTLDSTSFWL